MIAWYLNVFGTINTYAIGLVGQTDYLLIYIYHTLIKESH